MRTTLNIDTVLMEKLLETTKKILSYQGKFDIENNWLQLEKEELMEYENKKN